jgi:hypothetical protein
VKDFIQTKELGCPVHNDHFQFRTRRRATPLYKAISAYSHLLNEITYVESRIANTRGIHISQDGFKIRY